MNWFSRLGVKFREIFLCQRPASLFLLGGKIILHELIRFLNENFEKGGDGRLLDAGAGTRPYLSVYRDYFSTTYSFDVPYSPHDVTSVDVIASSLHLPFRDGAFDCVLCTEVLEHIPDPLQALTEYQRVLKAGGKLFLTTPFFNPLHEIPHDYYRYTPFALRYMAEKAGFRMESIVQKGGIIAFFLLFMQYLWVRFWQALSRYWHIQFLHPYNPAVYFTIILPQLVYFSKWKRRMRRNAPNSVGADIFDNLSAVTLGYVTIFSKPIRARSDQQADKSIL
jgi:SAM-dependent methyltransferase